MCGIAGVFLKSGACSEDQITGMTTSLAHRGPDASGYFRKNNIAFGHRRLSILDLSENANQPFYSDDKRYVIVYNGEVYNFHEIARKYNIYQHTSSDTEIILKLFINKGPGFVKELNGMFAFAIFDQHLEELYLYRDRIGIKPLYYYLDDNSLYFASELKAVKTGLTDKKLSISQQAINEFLHLGYIPEPLSIYREIKKFPSGHYAKISCSDYKLDVKEYWNTSSHLRKDLSNNEQELKEQLKDLLISSVKYRMISDVPLGTFLSGGTDSSLVTAIAQDLSSHQVKTFSIGFEEAKFNESDHAREVAKYLKTDHHEFILKERDAQEQVSNLMDIYAEPYADSSAIPTLLVSKMARKEVTVTLSGDGGDELFHGYNMYNWAKRLNKSHINLFRMPIGWLLSKGDNRKKRASTLFKYPNIERIASHIFSQEQYLFDEREVHKLVSHNYHDGHTFHSSTIIDYNHLNRKLTPEEKQAYYDLNYYLKDDLLVKVDRASMFHSLETRVPILDHRIIEFALNVPPQFKVRDNIQKYLLKQVLYDYVPQKIMDRPKWGFSIPLIDWLKTDLGYMIDTSLSKEIIEKHSVVNWQNVSGLIKRFRKGEDYLYNRLWSLIMLHQFMEKID